MRIRRLQIDRFGLLAGQKAEELAPGLNIFLGDNEAGKSTCRNFLRAMIFGYKRGNRNDALDYATAASGGRAQKSALAGGALWLDCGEQGGSLHLQRRPGKYGGELKLYDQQGRELPAAYWQGFLSGLNAELYDKVFAFDLQDLASLESMSAQQVSAALHGAAFGTGFRSPAEVLQSLEKSRKDLFAPSPTAKTQAINKILLRLNEIQRQIRENGSDIQRHAALAAEEAALRETLAQKRRLLEALGLDWERTRSLAAAWESWQELQNLEAQLELNPHPGGAFEADSLARLEALCAERADKQALLEAREEELNQLERQLEEERPPADLLRLAPLCHRLAPQREEAALALKNIPLLEAEIEALRQEQERLLAELGGWNHSTALSLDISLAARQRVEELRDNLQQARQALEQAENELARQNAESERANLEEARLRQARAASTPAASAASAASSVADSPAGLEAAGAAESFGPIEAALFGPEMRQLLEQRGRDLEEAAQALQESGKNRLRLEREAASLDNAAESRNREMAALARQTCREDDLHERRQELGRLNQAAGEAARQTDMARRLELELAAARPPFFSFTSVKRDQRRVFPALLCLALAWLALYFPLAELFEGRASGLEISAADLPWTALGLGGLCLWGVLFWISPRLATLGLYHPQPGQRQLRLLECLGKTSELHAEVRQLAARLLNWLPAAQSVGKGGFEPGYAATSGWPAETFDPAALLAPLPAFGRRLEAFFKEQQQQQLRLQLLRLQEEQEQERQSGLAAQLAAARAEEGEAGEKLERQRRVWGEALRPYGLDAACPPSAALLIFDRAWRAAELRLALAEAKNRLAEKEQLARASQAQWTAWLAATPFPPSATPSLVLEAFNLLEKCRERQAELERRGRGLKAQQEALESFKAALDKLFTGLDASRAQLAGGLESPVQRFDRLLAAAEAAAGREERRGQKERDLQSLQSRRGETRARLTASEAALRQLLSLGGIDEETPLLQGAEEFRLRFSRARAHHALAQAGERLRLQLEQLAAAPRGNLPGGLPGVLPGEFTGELPGEAPGGMLGEALDGLTEQAAFRPQKLWPGQTAFFQALQAASRDALSSRQEELRGQLEEEAVAQEAVLTRLGEIKANLAALAEGEGNAQLRREEAALREELEQLARRWAALSLAQAFIGRAKRSFETERQDKVVRQAGDFFQKFTLGRYQGLIFDLESRGLKAAAVPDPAQATGGVLNLDSEEALSRGTREQLYLALRLAYIRQHNQSGESLPLVMDDILVNFDPDRSARAAAVLAEFAAQNQIIFFTCHPHMDKLLSEAAAQTATPCARYRIERGEISPA